MRVRMSEPLNLSIDIRQNHEEESLRLKKTHFQVIHLAAFLLNFRQCYLDLFFEIEDSKHCDFKKDIFKRFTTSKSFINMKTSTRSWYYFLFGCTF